MNKLNGLKLRTKITATIALLLGFMLVIGIDAIINFTTIKSTSQTLSDEALPEIRTAVGLEEYAARKKLYLIDYLRTSDSESRQGIQASQETFSDYLQQGRQLADTTQDAGFLAALDSIQKSSGNFDKTVADVLQRQQQIYAITEDRARSANALNELLDTTSSALQSAIQADLEGTGLAADLTNLFTLLAIDESFADFNIDVYRALMTDDTAALKAALATGDLTRMAEGLAALAARTSSRADLTALAGGRELIRDYERAVRASVAQTEGMLAGAAQAITLGDELMDQAEAMAMTSMQQSLDIAQQNVAEVDQGIWVISILIAVALVIGGVIGIWLVRSVMSQLGAVVAAAGKMAKGDFNFQLESDVQDEIGGVVRAVASVQQSVQRMATDTKMLAGAAVAGKLGTRADASQHEGDFREIVAGINSTLDAVIGPLNVAADYVENIAKGNIPAKITDEYKGDFNALKNNLNTCIEAVNGLITDANMLSQAAVDGKLDTRADVSHHEGDFRRIVAGVNDTLDAVVGPINEVKRVMLALADGDLTQQIDGHYAGEFKVLQVAVNDSLTKLNELVSGIKGSADAINTAAKEIAAGNTNLSQRTEEQASSLEETASSMEELTSTVKQNADNARQANQLAHGASDVATKGGDKVREVVVTMGAITESSKKISDIIQVIDGIAFQTNILALNAAVEAARAGEQGRGFAVVAGEVRTLAQRSAAAAKEIKTLINDSVDTVEGGSKLVEQAGATMEEIVSAVKRVTDIMAEISAASDEQSQGIDQVSTAITQMDEVTQQNAALVEQSAAAASSLEDQAHGLAEAVAVFRIDNATASGIANPRRSVAAPAAPTRAKAKPQPQPAKPGAQRKAPKPAALADAGEEWAEF